MLIAPSKFFENRTVKELRVFTEALPKTVTEQLMWAKGLYFADHYFRYDYKGDIRLSMLSAGGEVKAFWRGLFEGSGSVSMCFLEGMFRPVVSLSGSPRFLWTFFEKMYDLNPRFDPTAIGLSQVGTQRCMLKGLSARDLIAILWPNADVVCYESSRGPVREALDWIPREGETRRRMRKERGVNLGNALVSDVKPHGGKELVRFNLASTLLNSTDLRKKYKKLC